MRELDRGHPLLKVAPLIVRKRSGDKQYHIHKFLVQIGVGIGGLRFAENVYPRNPARNLTESVEIAGEFFVKCPRECRCRRHFIEPFLKLFLGFPSVQAVVGIKKCRGIHFVVANEFRCSKQPLTRVVFASIPCPHMGKPIFNGSRFILKLVNHINSFLSVGYQSRHNVISLVLITIVISYFNVFMNTMNSNVAST
ncbi:hypothetical protein SAMN04488103_1234 [Gemmobacter aquatilis]|uniref:Uncharacterized protein n=1 Tax=Gemmobacter aquatilis TaxID=933059 RepID=A0A1H8NS13_9RHOB|nr:hypothetical protein SAMN04488103_1234 [Gemmobacter aquatilis]